MYLLNHTNTTLTVGIFVDIKPGKYREVDSFVVNHADTAYAIRAKWATLHETPPKEFDFGTETISFEAPAIEGSTEYPGKAPVVAEEPAAVLAEPEQEVAVEPVAEEAVEEAVAEDAPRKGRAAKTKASE